MTMPVIEGHFRVSTRPSEQDKGASRVVVVRGGLSLLHLKISVLLYTWDYAVDFVFRGGASFERINERRRLSRWCFCCKSNTVAGQECWTTANERLRWGGINERRLQEQRMSVRPAERE